MHWGFISVVCTQSWILSLYKLGKITEAYYHGI